MVKSSIIVALLVSFSSIAQHKIEEKFSKSWSTKIGITTYRTNMVFHNGKLFVGSNGKNRNLQKDELDGVYEIDAKTGKILYQYQVPFLGDNDVNGVAISDNKLYFGTDNYYFFCFDLTSKEELWKFKTLYDIESVPAIADLNKDDHGDVVFNVEQNGVYALDGKTGELIWQNNDITSHNGNTPVVAYDVNQDGIMDFLTSGRGYPENSDLAGFKMAHYGDYNMCINGKDGKTLWAVKTGAGVHTKAFIHKTNKQVEFAFLDCYGELSLIDLQGNLKKAVGFGYDKFSSPIITPDGQLFFGNTCIPFQDNKFKQIDYDEQKILTLKDEVTMVNLKADGRFSASPVIADVLAKKTTQVLNISEKGELYIANTKGETLLTFYLPSGAEASLYIDDIDNDGYLEILIADLEGNLSCYNTKSKAKAIKKGY